MHSCVARLIVRSLAGAMFLPAVLFPASNRLQVVDKAATEWIGIRLETARMTTAWAADRTLLESIAAGLEQRASVLDEKRELLLAKTAGDREEVAALEAKVAAGVDDLRVAEGRLKEFSAKVLGLQAVLPPRLASALEMSFRSLGQADLPASERMQLVITVLTRCAQFNRTVTSGDEVLAIDPGESARSVEVIYWGLSHGYALDRTARKAWLGSPGPERWEWTARPADVDAVARLVAIYNDKADPLFVSVPATVRHTNSRRDLPTP